MARDFNGSSDYLRFSGTPPVTTTPLTMSCWFNFDNATTAGILLWLGDEEHHLWTAHYISAEGAVAGDPVRAVSVVDNAFNVAESTSGFSAGTWHHACGVFASTTSRTIYLDGGSFATNTDLIDPTSLDSLWVGAEGRQVGPTAANFFDGKMAEIGVWSAALTSAEVAALAKGVSPMLVRPSSLVAYYPVMGRNSPETSLKGGYSLTPTGTSVFAHPRVIYPRRRTSHRSGPAAPATGQPIRKRMGGMVGNPFRARGVW